MEKILLNRYEETLSMGQKNNMGSDVVQYWHVPDAVPALMDRCQAHLEDLPVGWAHFAQEIAEFIQHHDVESLMLRPHAS